MPKGNLKTLPICLSNAIDFKCFKDIDLIIICCDTQLNVILPVNSKKNANNKSIVSKISQE